MRDAFTYDQSDGRFYSPDGELMGQGYSGKKGVWRNDHGFEAAVAMGPIPVGRYAITVPDHPHAHLASPVWRLTPVDHDAHGRSGFLIHGNNTQDDASQGCIILDHDVRVALVHYSERLLDVVP